MKIRPVVQSSLFFKFAKFVFIDNKKDLFGQSKFLKIVSKPDNYRLSIIFLTLTIICFWYKLSLVDFGLGWVVGYKLWAVFLALSFIFCEKRYIFSTRAIVYLLLFEVSLLVSGLWASISGLDIEMLFTGVLSLTPFVVAFVVASTYRQKNILIDIILVLSLPLIISGLVQWFYGVDTTGLWVSSSESLIKTRVFGILENPNALGGVLMLTTIIGLFRFLSQKKWYYAVYIVLSFSVLVLTFSRSAWLGLATSLLVAVVIKQWRLILFAPLALFALISSTIRQRLLAVFSPNYLTDASLDGRVWSINNMIELFKTSPVFGVGSGAYGTQSAIQYNSPVYLRGLQNGYLPFGATDSQWFQILSQLGLFGIVSFLLFMISYFVNNLREYVRTKSYLSLGMLAAIIALLMNGFFENILSFGVTAVLVGSYLGLGNSHD